VGHGLLSDLAAWLSGLAIKPYQGGAFMPTMLRHSCGHHLAASGTDTRRIQDYLGHASITSTQIYTQLQSIHLKGIWK
jgi:site-specific recombinase XerD